MDVARLREIDPLQQMSACLSNYLLDAYQVIAMEHGISLEEASTYVIHLLVRSATCSHGGEPTNSQRVAAAHPTAPPQHTSIGQDTPPPPIHTSMIPQHLELEFEGCSLVYLWSQTLRAML